LPCFALLVPCRPSFYFKLHFRGTALRPLAPTVLRWLRLGGGGGGPLVLLIWVLLRYLPQLALLQNPDLPMRIANPETPPPSGSTGPGCRPLVPTDVNFAAPVGRFVHGPAQAAPCLARTTIFFFFFAEQTPHVRLRASRPPSFAPGPVRRFWTVLLGPLCVGRRLFFFQAGRPALHSDPKGERTAWNPAPLRSFFLLFPWICAGCSPALLGRLATTSSLVAGPSPFPAGCSPTYLGPAPFALTGWRRGARLPHSMKQPA